MISKPQTGKQFTGLIDFSNLFYKAYYVCLYHDKPELDLSNIEDQGLLIRRVVKNIHSSVKSLFINQAILCFDQGSFRKTLYPEYKANRIDKEQALKDCIEILYEIYKQKVGVLRVENLEGDDLIALTAESNYIPNNIYIAVSSDEDIRQKCSRQVFVLDPKSGGKKMYSSFTTTSLLSDVPQEIIDPEYVFFLKLCKGCKGDNVPPLLPKGTRETKIKKVYEKYLASNKTPTAIKNFFLEEKIEITEQQINLQTRLVGLSAGFLPKDGIQEWKKQMEDLIESSYEDFSITNILKGSIYFDVNYQK